LHKLCQLIQLYLKFVFHFRDMKKLIGSTIILFVIACTDTVRSQNKVSIPAFTAYAMPAEQSSEEEESILFSAKNGLEHWTDPNQQIQFYFDIRKPGSLDLALLIKSNVAGNKLAASFAPNESAETGNLPSLSGPVLAGWLLKNRGSIYCRCLPWSIKERQLLIYNRWS
jgi:hypothetical protein